MSDQLFFIAILVIVALMVVILAVLLGFLIGSRNTAPSKRLGKAHRTKKSPPRKSALKRFFLFLKKHWPKRKKSSKVAGSNGADAKNSPTAARYIVKGLSAVGFVIFGIFALNAAFSALVPSEAVRAMGAFGMIYSFGAFLVAIVLGVIAAVLLRQLTK